MLRLCRGAATPLRASLARATRALTTGGIPVGAQPQIVVSAAAAHRQGASNDIAAVIFEEGASIASTKKVMLEDHFAMLLSVYTPKSPDSLVAKLRSPDVASRLGFAVQAELLDPSRAAEKKGVAEQRRMKLTCPQRPGIVLAVTELLKDHSCSVSSIEADTVAKGSEIWFEIEAIIDVPSADTAEAVEGALRFWTEQEARANFIFDKFVRPNVTANV